ncbi:ABC transporter permease [Novisyntrophococcus fermenticellae]|uniref:ABC transporter permease n=1 Tax=Novisyntrophococcus fermenticellae TaxID=2068655 RepID=UPI001E38C3AC|nr:ABC transporter permease [Novisyntrophococcus fermenticellae]
MLHLLKYRFKSSLRNRPSMFWALLFPIILGTLFYFTIGKMDEDDFSTIPVAVVEGETSQEADNFQHFLQEIEESDSHIIVVKYMKEDAAAKALEEREVKGIFYTEDQISLTVAAKGIEESILESLLNSYVDSAKMMTQIGQIHPEGMNAAISSMSNYQNLVQSVSLKGRSIDGNVQYFYALIAMACMYGCFLGFDAALGLQANLTPLAARRCITPTHKLKIIVSDMAGVLIIHFANVSILVLYLRFILGIGFAGEMGKMLLVSGIGSMIGVSLGILVGSAGRMTENLKIGIMLGVSMTCSFLSGLMIGGMKDIVEKHAPLVNRLNPAALITDAFYCINVYDNPERFYRDLGTLAVLGVLMLAGAYLIVRKECYESI